MTKLSLKDIISISNLKIWMKNNINIYNDKEIPDEHINIIMNYIEELTKKGDFSHDRLIWFNAINSARKQQEEYEGFKKRHS